MKKWHQEAKMTPRSQNDTQKLARASQNVSEIGTGEPKCLRNWHGRAKMAPKLTRASQTSGFFGQRREATLRQHSGMNSRQRCLEAALGLGHNLRGGELHTPPIIPLKSKTKVIAVDVKVQKLKKWHGRAKMSQKLARASQNVSEIGTDEPKCRRNWHGRAEIGTGEPNFGIHWATSRGNS